MRAGLLRHRIAVDEAVTSQSSSGEPVVSWSQRATVWGGIEHLSGREALIASQIDAAITTRITLRWGQSISGLNARWRLRHGQTIYNIISVINTDERNQSWVLMCGSGTNRG